MVKIADNQNSGKVKIAGANTACVKIAAITKKQVAQIAYFHYNLGMPTESQFHG